MEFIDIDTTEREQMVDVTREVAGAVTASGIREGMAVVQTMHTTAGMTVNENADPDVAADFISGLRAIVPRAGAWRHAEGNSDAHLKATLVGPSITLGVSGGDLVLGTWQGVYFCEFDGPRSRRIGISVVGAKHTRS